MKHGQYSPHPILSDYVKSLWTSERDFQPPNDTFELLPDSYIELVLSFGSHCQIDDGQTVRDLPRCYIVGLLDKPIRLRAKGLVKTVAARFFAWGFFPLFNIDMQQLPNAVRQFESVGRRLTEEIARAVEKDDDETAIEALHSFLIERALSMQFDQKEIRASAQWLFKQKGQVKISELADRFHYSDRQLERKFQQQVGISPKALARKVRFEQARNHLTRDPHANLAVLAQDYGYADQAHLTRDFKKFSHKTPTQFASQMLALREVMRTNYYVVFFQDEVQLGR